MTTPPDHESGLVRELSRTELLELTESGDGLRVSVYLKRSRESARTAQRIAWTNLLGSAERQLAANGLVGGEARCLLAPARRVIDGRHAHARGIAFLGNARFSRAMSLAIQVPSMAVVGERCYLRPLLPLLESKVHYYVLGLSSDDVRLFAGDHELVKELALDGLPLAALASMPRSRRPAGAFVADRRSAGIRGVWHGVDGATDDVDKQRIVAHFREVDTAVKKILRNSGAPLVLGGVGYLHALYREVNSYPTLVPDGIIGGLGDMTPKQLHERAWPLVEPALHAERRDALARFAQLEGAGRTVSELSAAARMAENGRVDTLIVAALDVASGSAETVHDDWMLLERAIAGTLRHGGTVHVVDGESMPTSTSLAGILRF